MIHHLLRPCIALLACTPCFSDNISAKQVPLQQHYDKAALLNYLGWHGVKASSPAPHYAPITQALFSSNTRHTQAASSRSSPIDSSGEPIPYTLTEEDGTTCLRYDAKANESYTLTMNYHSS